jgi:hypothetical protein
MNLQQPNTHGRDWIENKVRQVASEQGQTVRAFDWTTDPGAPANHARWLIWVSREGLRDVRIDVSQTQVDDVERESVDRQAVEAEIREKLK